MKSGILQTVGKTISGIAVAQSESDSPRNQIFLEFNDGTYFEIWGDDFSCNASLDKGDLETAKHYLRSSGAYFTMTSRAIGE